MEAIEKLIAKDLLKIKAVFFRPDEPFTWASGIKSPVYCDNRLTLTAPEVRLDVEEGLARLVRKHYPEAEVLMGTSTAGIAHAAAVDDGQTGGDLRHGAVEIVKHIQTVSFTSGSFRRSRDVALRAWQMAMASASAESSGRGTAFSFSSRRVISMTCRFSARP